MEDSDTPALRADGTLKDASELDWLNSPSDKHPDPLSVLESGPPPTRSPSPYPGLSDKTPAQKIAGKRTIMASRRYGSDSSQEPSFLAQIAGMSVFFSSCSPNLLNYSYYRQLKDINNHST
jgi:hypothetical protein